MPRCNHPLYHLRLRAAGVFRFSATIFNPAPNHQPLIWIAPSEEDIDAEQDAALRSYS